MKSVAYSQAYLIFHDDCHDFNYLCPMKPLAFLCIPALFVLTSWLPLPPRAAGPPVLTLQASGGSGGTDITAFVDGVEIINALSGLPAREPLSNASFEFPAHPTYGYAPTGGTWTFSASAGLAHNGSAFGSPAAPDGGQVAFLQTRGTDSGYLRQAIPSLPPGLYQVRLRVAQRACCSGTFDQGIRIWVDDVLLGTVVPDRDGQFHTYTSSSFSVSEPLGHRSRL